MIIDTTLQQEAYIPEMSVKSLQQLCKIPGANQCVSGLTLCAGRPLLLIAGQGATATVWTPDLLQTLAQGRQVTVFTNRGIGLSQDLVETQNSTVAGVCFCL